MWLQIQKIVEQILSPWERSFEENLRTIKVERDKNRNSGIFVKIFSIRNFSSNAKIVLKDFRGNDFELNLVET